MFGKGWTDYTTNGNNMMMQHFPDFVGTTVAGNRGASGIDGLLSTAIGLAVGSNKHVSCYFSQAAYSTESIPIILV
jgi:isochorismate synthase/2-succinyl-5-enolpyruvyl-6-hydroxy-3-cyclohexene-1-carboxylate synthase/2-succinyl-6-hydroxy-2,4-cyclohexadiene-1-carboxylate synthase/O-succinylbenzoate synthase